MIYKVLYSLIIFLGAFLTFMFQPVTGKILTPQYGGAADIWTSCLVFFQFVLFSGYLLALFLNKLKPKVNAIIYLILFIGALILFKLPTEFGSWLIGEGSYPLISLFASLFKYAFLPVLVLSTISISMQNWYTKQTGESPYILYSISNIGSFLALFLYPLVYEPIMGLKSTVNLWHGAFAFLVVLIIAASIIYYTKSADDKEETASTAAIPLKSFAYWIALSAAGTILLTSYTTFVTVRVLPIPMLWSLFLGVYLLSFVLCFGSEKFYKKNLIIALIPVIALINVFSNNMIGKINLGPLALVSITAILFFLFLMICNGEIYKTRPEPSRLSEFYLSIAFGGVLGGIFVNIIAPAIFNSYIEFTLINAIMYIFALYLFMKDMIAKRPISKKAWAKIIVLSIVAIIAAGYYCFIGFYKDKNVVIKYKRNFYGVVYTAMYKDKKIKTIANGVTTHGAQVYDPKTDTYTQMPLTYYSDTSAFAYAYEGMKNFHGKKNKPLNIGAIGLGAGTAASYTKPNDRITFYEIDPKMYDLAKNDFTYLKDAKGSVDVLLGDARIVLDKQDGQKYDILLVDAFSSDSIPVHLITKEAFDIYKKHMKNDGIILFHISNNYLSLEKVLKKIADNEGLKSVYFASNYLAGENASGADKYIYTTQYFLVFMPDNKLYDKFMGYKYGTKSKRRLLTVIGGGVKDDEFLKPFTDDYSSLFRVFKFWQ